MPLETVKALVTQLVQIMARTPMLAQFIVGSRFYVAGDENPEHVKSESYGVPLWYEPHQCDQPGESDEAQVFLLRYTFPGRIDPVIMTIQYERIADQRVNMEYRASVVYDLGLLCIMMVEAMKKHGVGDIPATITGMVTRRAEAMVVSGNNILAELQPDGTDEA